MRPSFLAPLLSLLFHTTTTTAAPSLTPSSSSSDPAPPWPEKVAQMSTHLRTLGTALGNPGWGYGSVINLTFSDGDCHQIRLYNWDCDYAIPYNLSVVADWLDASDAASQNRTRWENTLDDYHYYSMAWYRDPKDGFAFYDAARWTWGMCGNRGPQSACGHVYCLLRNGTTAGVGTVPEGQTPWMDPNDRSRLCTWLRG